MGCSIVIKPASETPLSALSLCELAERAGALLILTGDTLAVVIGVLGTGLLFAGLTIAVGIAILAQPGIALVKLTLILGAFFVADGIMGFIVAWSVRPEKGWGWLIFNALITVVLGVMILNGWPESSLVVIGLLVGIRLVFAGMTMLTLGTAGRQVATRQGHL